MNAATSKRQYPQPWMIVAAMFVVATFSWGLSFYGLGFYLRELNVRHGWSLTTLSLITFAFHSAATVLSFPVSDHLARRGPRRVFAFGAIATATSVGAIGYVTDIWQLVVVYLAMAVGWSCLSLNPISATVLAWYHPDRSGTPLTIALTGASAGGVIVVPLLVAFNEAVGLRTTLLIAAAAELAIVGGLALAVVEGPRDVGHSGGTGAAVDRAPPAWNLLGLARFWTLSAGLGLAIAAQVGFLVHQLSFLTISVDPPGAARIVALTTISGFAGRLIFIGVTRLVSPLTAGLLFLTAQALALGLLARQDANITTLAVLSALFGLGIGIVVTIPPLLTRTYFAEQPFTSTFPLVNATFSLAVALGAPATALLHDRLDGYRSAFAVLALADLAAVLLLIASNRGPHERPRPLGRQHDGARHVRSPRPESRHATPGSRR